MKTDQDLIIIGAGGAGLSAAQYGARGNLRTLVLEELSSGGQALLIDNLENYPGFPDSVTGFDFTQKMEDQARKFGAQFENAAVSGLRKEDGHFVVETDRGPLTSLTVILATGAKHKTLGVPGEAELSGRGVSYCATCDGPFFKGKRMLVVGGGDAACDEATYLSHLAESILMIHRRDRFRAQKAVAARVLANPKITVRFNTELRRIEGDKAVKSVTLFNNATGKECQEDVSAVFVFIGSDPKNALVKDLGVTLDDVGYVETNQRMETGLPGLYAVGDVRASPFRQLVVAAAEGGIAAHAAGQYIDELKGEKYS
ncbi:MAG TPA: thioredoxin-disulfide reductase [Spirochaetia bacterium]|nr:thioredoxin-disulfide reductase [Spirochaetia bacterium]